MGKKRIIKKSGKGLDQGRKERAMSKVTKRHLEKGVLHIEATFNNTKAILTDEKGNAVVSSSAGALGFSGARKSTPYAAQLAAEKCARAAMEHGVKKVDVLVRGPGSGRETAIRSLQAAGLDVTGVKDVTPQAHNGCRPRKRRRV